MSQELAQQNLGLLQNIAKQMAGSGFLAAADPTESLSDGIGSSYGIIHYRGKNWSLSYRGQTFLFTRPDDGSPASYIDVVILKQARSKSKSLYEGFDQDAMNKRPICSSIDGVTPDADAQTPQSNACAVCPRNVWRTDAQGKRSKECSDYKRVAVLLIPTVSARMFNGTPLMEPVFLRVPAASLADLASYGDQLKNVGLPYFGVVTRVSFDPTKAHPQFQFRPLQGLTKAEEPVILPLREDATTKRIVGEDRAVQGQPILIPQRQVDTGLAAPTNVVPLHTPVVHQVAPAPAVAPQPTFVAPAPAPAPQVIDMTPVTTGFSAPAAPPPAAAPQQAQTIAADVGKPEMADADLDARIAQFLPQV